MTIKTNKEKTDLEIAQEFFKVLEKELKPFNITKTITEELIKIDFADHLEVCIEKNKVTTKDNFNIKHTFDEADFLDALVRTRHEIVQKRNLVNYINL